MKVIYLSYKFIAEQENMQLKTFVLCTKHFYRKLAARRKMCI